MGGENIYKGNANNTGNKSDADGHEMQEKKKEVILFLASILT
jgi:hypothetical protein